MVPRFQTLKNSIGDLRQQVADIDAMKSNRKDFEERFESTHSMLLQDMSVLQQVSKDALSRLKSELEAEKKGLKKKRNCLNTELLLLISKGGATKNGFEKIGTNSRPSRSNMWVRNIFEG